MDPAEINRNGTIVRAADVPSAADRPFSPYYSVRKLGRVPGWVAADAGFYSRANEEEAKASLVRPRRGRRLQNKVRTAMHGDHTLC